MPTAHGQTKLVTYLLLKSEHKVFLVQYKDSPNPKRHGWWIPAPELRYGEHPEDCAKRVLSSLGINLAKLESRGIDSFVTRDWHVLFHYVAESEVQPTIGTEYEKGEWFDIDHLPDASTFAHGPWERDLVLKLAQN